MKSLLSALLLSFFIASISHANATSDAASTTLATPSASTPSAAEVTPEFVIQSPDSVPAKGKHIIIDGDNVEEIYQPDERTITPKLDTQEDIDDFIAQLLAEDSNSGSSGEDVPPPPPRKVLTEEEKEQLRKEKEEETRVKRADITSRHTKWEKRLKDAGEEEVEELLEKVRALRQKVVEDMRNKPEMFDLLKKMQKEGFDNVYKVETYLTKVKRDGKDDDTAANWGKVVGKISQMLDDRTIETTEYLKNWHRAIMTKEKEIFEASAKILENIADEAQADIGMDYAWLDDVTTNDWTRYHKLKDDVKHYTSIFESIFNSKHPEMKENPVHVELMQVETAMVRVAADLKEALDKVKLKGEMWLRGEIEETGTTDSIVDETATASEPDITLHLYERKESTASKPKPTHGEL